MTGTDLIAPETDRHLAALASRYRRAGGLGLQLLNLLGGQAENLLERLPDGAKEQLEEATERALGVAMRAARSSRGVVRDQPGSINTALATAMGAAGGFGGLPSALAELPVTVTVLLRTIQGIAAEYGFDPDDPEIEAACLQVFAAAGPLEADDGANTGFLAVRVTLTGPAVHGIIARIAPRLATVLGQKLAAQTVPILGAAAGAGANYTYTRYYQEMAHVQFGLRRLALDAGLSPEEALEAFRLRMG